MAHWDQEAGSREKQLVIQFEAQRWQGSADVPTRQDKLELLLEIDCRLIFEASSSHHGFDESCSSVTLASMRILGHYFSPKRGETLLIHPFRTLIAWRRKSLVVLGLLRRLLLRVLPKEEAMLQCSDRVAAQAMVSRKRL